MKPFIAFFLLAGFISLQSCKSKNKIIWQIGNADNSSAEFSLAPNEYKRFLEKDFGWEDRFFLVGQSEIKSDFPYVLPGPSDEWGGTWSTAGWRSHSINILFGIEKLPKNGEWKLIVDLLDNNSEKLPVFKIIINGKSWKYEFPEGSGNNSIEDSTSSGKEFLIEIPIDNKLIKAGGNEITLATIQGSWVMFDQVRLEGPGNARLMDNTEVFLRNVQAANYEIETPSGKAQPLLIDIEHLSGKPKLNILLDGNEIFAETIETGRYIFEAPMPAVATSTKSKYEIRIDGKKLQSGKIVPHYTGKYGPKKNNLMKMH